MKAACIGVSEAGDCCKEFGVGERARDDAISIGVGQLAELAQLGARSTTTLHGPGSPINKLVSWNDADARRALRIAAERAPSRITQTIEPEAGRVLWIT
jgi:hypothetical protein